LISLFLKVFEEGAVIWNRKDLERLRAFKERCEADNKSELFALWREYASAANQFLFLAYLIAYKRKHGEPISKAERISKKKISDRIEAARSRLERACRENGVPFPDSKLTPSEVSILYAMASSELKR